MIKFSTGKAYLIKRFFQTLSKKFFKLLKNLLNNSKKINDWMTQASAQRGAACVRRAVIYRGLL